MADDEYVPVPPLPVSEAELKYIDDAIAHMVKVGRRQSITAPRIRYQVIMSDADLLKRTDELLAETLTSLKRQVPDDTGEKLFERITKVVDGWADHDEQNTLAVIFYRLMDSMRFMIAYRGKYRGIERKSSMTKSEALAELKLRGIGKR